MTPSPRFPWVLAAMAWAVATPGIAQNFEGLAFDPPFQAKDSPPLILDGPPSDEVFDFPGGVPSLDEIIDAGATIPGFSSPRDPFEGHFADDDPFAGRPDGDPELLYADSGGSGAGGNPGESGVTRPLEFFSDGGLFDTPVASSSLNLMMDDRDGEPSPHLSLIGTRGFSAPVTLVPEPSAALLACCGLIPLLRRRR